MSNTYPTNFPDVLFGDDLDLYARECPNDYVGLQQDVKHLQRQAPGSNLDDLSKGVDVAVRLSGTLGDLQAACGELEEQLAQDERIASASVNVIVNPAGSSTPYSLDVQIEPSAIVLPPVTG